jgi:hypothetical protein
MMGEKAVLPLLFVAKLPTTAKWTTLLHSLFMSVVAVCGAQYGMYVVRDLT